MTMASTPTRLTVLGLVLGTLVGLSVTGCRSAMSDVESPGLRVRPAVAFEMMADAPAMPVIDLRTPEEFAGKLGRLARADNVPLDVFERRLEDFSYLREVTFLVYCRGWDDCGERAMRLLVGNGFEDAVLMEGGIEGWLRDGFGTVEAGMLPADPGMRIPVEVEGGGDRDLLPEPP